MVGSCFQKPQEHCRDVAEARVATLGLRGCECLTCLVQAVCVRSGVCAVSENKSTTFQMFQLGSPTDTTGGPQGTRGSQ